MVNEGQPVDFVAKLAELRARKGLTPPPPPAQQPPASVPEPRWSQENLLPDLGGPDLTDADKALDAFVDGIDIIAAYNKWCGKMRPDPAGKREGIKISCPNPQHPDKDPSAWINLDKQTWFCGGCQEGGDAHDIAAYAFGYPVPGYKDGETFHKLREDMASDFGFHIKQVAGGKIAWTDEPPKSPPPPPVPTGVPPTVQEQLPEPDDDNVVQMFDESEPDAELVAYPEIDWRSIVPTDTFLHEYMSACTNDDAPEEYHFWNGLVALGLVAGRKITLDDTHPVHANLMLCILGSTGSGKSRSRRHLNAVLREAAPYREDGTQTTGVKLVPEPSSGEYLVHQFAYEGKDPTNNKTSLGYQSVTGLVDFDELAGLLAKANRQGSSLKSTIMNISDAPYEVKIGGLQRGDFIAREPFCTITASTQPKALRTLLSRTDAGSGFINRWVFAGGKRKKIEAIGGTRSTISVDLEPATQKLKEVRGWAGFERVIGLEDDTYQEFNKYFETVLLPMKLKDQSDMLQRIDLLAKKLMLLLTINLKRDKVPLFVLEAVKVLIDYVIECYGIISDNIGVTVMQDVMNDIKRQVENYQKRKGEGMTVSMLVKFLKRKSYTYEQLEKAIKVMTSLDILELEKPKPGPGRKSTKYKVVGA